MTIGASFDDVLAAACTGADWAMAVLYRDLNPALLRYVHAQHPDAAEDIASEVWLAAATNLGSFSGDEAGFRSWLFTIARRRAIDHGRRRARRRTDAVGNEVFEQRAAADDTAAAEVAEIMGRSVGSVRVLQHRALRRLAARLTPDKEGVTG